MKSVKIEVAVRDENECGTSACRRLRREGRLPVNLYGLARKERSLSMDLHKMELLIERGETVVELTLDDNTQVALVRDVQFDSLGQKVIHADLMRIDRDVPVRVNVPIRFVGTAPTAEGSIVERQMDSVSLEILPLEIPREFVVNLGKVPIDGSFTVGQLELPGSAKLDDVDEDDVIVVNHIHVEKEPEPDEEGDEATEPEVIGKGKDDDEEDEDDDKK